MPSMVVFADTVPTPEYVREVFLRVSKASIFEESPVAYEVEPATGFRSLEAAIFLSLVTLNLNLLEKFVDAVVVDRSCPGKSSEIYVTYNNEMYNLHVSFSNCINDFPDGSIVKAKYLEGYYLEFAGEYDTITTIVMESITFMFLVMSVVGVYQTFFPKKAEEEN